MEILKRLRQDPDNRSLRDALLITINGIAAGMVRRTGKYFIVLVLFIFGGEVLRGFSFVFGIGIITGTYSSVFVASSLVVDWKQRVMKKAGIKAFAKS